MILAWGNDFYTKRGQILLETSICTSSMIIEGIEEHKEILNKIDLSEKQNETTI